MPSLLTWRLWRALRSPEAGNTVFERVQGQPIDLPGKRLLTRFSPVARVIAIVLPAIVVLIAPVALLLASNLLGALIAFNIMSTIQRERDQRTYELIALTPMGLGRVNWLIASACTQRLNAVDRLAQFRTLAIITLVLLVFYVFRNGLPAVGALLLILLALNLDAIQSLIVGCLSGMLAQGFREQGAPYAALAIFAFVQIILVYLPITAAGVVLYDLLRPTRRSAWNVYAGIALALLALSFVLREAIIQAIWRTLERSLL